jgi:Tfp pilus assembly protein PilV
MCGSLGRRFAEAVTRRADMRSSRDKQRGFAMPAMFVAVLVIFAGSLNVKGKDGMTVADAMGLSTPQTEFAAVELVEEKDSNQAEEF